MKLFTLICIIIFLSLDCNTLPISSINNYSNNGQMYSHVNEDYTSFNGVEREEGGIYSDFDYYENTGDLLNHYLEKAFDIFNYLFGGYTDKTNKGNNLSGSSGNGKDFPPPESVLSEGINMPSTKNVPSTKSVPKDTEDDMDISSLPPKDIPSTKSVPKDTEDDMDISSLPPKDISSPESVPSEGINVPSTKNIPSIKSVPKDTADDMDISSLPPKNIPSTKSVPKDTEDDMDISSLPPKSIPSTKSVSKDTEDDEDISSLPPKSIPSTKSVPKDTEDDMDISTLPPKNVPNSTNENISYGPDSLIPEYDSIDPNEILRNSNNNENIEENEF